MHPIKKIYLQEFIIEVIVNVIFSIILGSLLFSAIYFQGKITEGYEILAFIVAILVFLVVSLPKVISDFIKDWKELKKRYNN